MLRVQGKLDEVEALLREIVDARREHAAHAAARTACRDEPSGAYPSTMRAISNLATLLVARGRHAEAEPLIREALAGKVLAYGAHHPQTLSSVAWLASVLQELGRSEEAKPLYLDVLAHDRHMGGDARRDGTLRPMFKV